MPLSYSSGYSSVRPTEIQQQQADPFAAALQAVQERKKAQQERQQKLVQSREQFAKDEYYGMHADLLRQASQQLIDREDDFARDDVSMQKYIEAWQNLSDMADMFKTYKANTYGSPEDDPSAATFLAAEKRSMGIDPYAADGFEASVGYDDMMEQLDNLNQGSMEVSLGDNLEILIDRKPLIETDFKTSNNPFDPKLNVANISGARAFEGIWDGRDATPEAIKAKMQVHLENGDNMIKAVNHHIRSVKEEGNPNYNFNAEDVLNDPEESAKAIERYIQEAQEYYETQDKEKKPDADAERKAEKRKQFLDGISRSGTIDVLDPSSDPSSPEYLSEGSVGTVSIPGGTLYVDESDLNMYFRDSNYNKAFIYSNNPTTTISIDSGTQASVRTALANYGVTLEELYKILKQSS